MDTSPAIRIMKKVVLPMILIWNNRNVRAENTSRSICLYCYECCSKTKTSNSNTTRREIKLLSKSLSKVKISIFFTKKMVVVFLWLLYYFTHLIWESGNPIHDGIGIRDPNSENRSSKDSKPTRGDRTSNRIIYVYTCIANSCMCIRIHVYIWSWLQLLYIYIRIHYIYKLYKSILYN